MCGEHTRSNSGFGILAQEYFSMQTGAGIEPPFFWLTDDLLYLLSHSSSKMHIWSWSTAYTNDTAGIAATQIAKINK